MIKRKLSLKLADLELPKDYDMRRDGISQSLLSIFPLCRMKFLLKVNRWRLKNDNGNYVFGNIVHDVLEWVYKKGKFPKRKQLQKLIDKSMREMEDSLSLVALQKLEHNGAVAEVVLWEYFKYYISDFREMKFEELERVFDVPFKGFRTKGKKDGLFKKKSRFLMEHKTKGRVKEDILENVLNFDFQNLFYITSEEEESKKPLSKVMYNILRNPGLKQGVREDYGDYLERIRLDISNRPEFYFIRYEVSYSAEDKRIFRKELEAKLIEAEAFLKGKMPLYRNQNACEIPFTCEYLHACSSGHLTGYEQGPTLFPEL